MNACQQRVLAFAQQNLGSTLATFALLRAPRHKKDQYLAGIIMSDGTGSVVDNFIQIAQACRSYLEMLRDHILSPAMRANSFISGPYVSNANPGDYSDGPVFHLTIHGASAQVLAAAIIPFCCIKLEALNTLAGNVNYAGPDNLDDAAMANFTLHSWTRAGLFDGDGGIDAHNIPNNRNPCSYLRLTFSSTKTSALARKFAAATGFNYHKGTACTGAAAVVTKFTKSMACKGKLGRKGFKMYACAATWCAFDPLFMQPGNTQKIKSIIWRNIPSALLALCAKFPSSGLNGARSINCQRAFLLSRYKVYLELGLIRCIRSRASADHTLLMPNGPVQAFPQLLAIKPSWQQ